MGRNLGVFCMNHCEPCLFSLVVKILDLPPLSRLNFHVIVAKITGQWYLTHICKYLFDPHSILIGKLILIGFKET
ncbi:hypothetical protein RIF29_27394 [Crotalaria pallida]|uniref:Uncharacterized protein n=1 Tax=Crotalaria pallida TaxID=3830 RepID=A0AAN9ETV6_CROPI